MGLGADEVVAVVAAQAVSARDRAARSQITDA